MLLRIEFGGVPGQAVKADVLGNPEVLGSVRTSAVDDHDDEFVDVRSADLFKELIHAVCVHLLADHPVECSFDGADRAVHVDELSFVSVVDDGAEGTR